MNTPTSASSSAVTARPQEPSVGAGATPVCRGRTVTLAGGDCTGVLLVPQVPLATTVLMMLAAPRSACTTL